MQSCNAFDCFSSNKSIWFFIFKYCLKYFLFFIYSNILSSVYLLSKLLCTRLGACIFKYFSITIYFMFDYVLCKSHLLLFGSRKSNSNIISKPISNNNEWSNCINCQHFPRKSDGIIAIINNNTLPFAVNISIVVYIMQPVDPQHCIRIAYPERRVTPTDYSTVFYWYLLYCKRLYINYIRTFFY